MVDITPGALLPKMPSLSLSQGGLMKMIIIFICFFIILFAVGWGIWVIVQKFRFRENFILFEKISGKIIPTLRDKGRVVRLGKAGDYWAIWQKSKRVSPQPQKKINKNTSWWYKTEDGGIVNFDLDDFDEKMKTAGYKPMAEDMRLMRIAIQRNLANEFKKENWLQKYGTFLALGFLAIILLICTLIIFSKMGGLINAIGSQSVSLDSRNAQSMEMMSKSMQLMENIYSRMSSGGIPAVKPGG